MSDEEILTQDEKDTLLKGVADSTEEGYAGGDGQVVPYDFRHPANKLKDHLPLMEVANHRFAELMTTDISTFLRQSVRVEVDSFSMLKYEEYTHSLGTGGSINRVKLSPLPGASLMYLNAELIYTMVDRFFGGGGGKPEISDNRPLTNTERRMVEHVINSAFKSLAGAWSTLFDIQPQFVREEIGPEVTSPANPAEVMVTSKFRVIFPKGEGEFHIAIPYSSIEPVKPLLKAMLDRPDADDAEWSRQFTDMFLESPLELRGTISETPITLGKLLEFKEGSFIPLGQNQQATFYVENIPLFRAMVGASNGMISAKIL